MSQPPPDLPRTPKLKHTGLAFPSTPCPGQCGPPHTHTCAHTSTHTCPRTHTYTHQPCSPSPVLDHTSESFCGQGWPYRKDVHSPEAIIATGNYQGSITIKMNLGMRVESEEKLTSRGSACPEHQVARVSTICPAFQTCSLPGGCQTPGVRQVRW